MLKNSWIFAAACLWLCCFFSNMQAASSRHYNVTPWKVGEGLLPQGSVISVIQTRDGYLWLGTLNGLVRFDGIRFKIFDEANTPGLGSGEIVYLFEDSRRNLWVGTQTAGVFLIKKDGSVKGVDLGRGSREGRLMSVCEDPGGAVWLYTADGQLARYLDGQVSVLNAGGAIDRYSLCRSLIIEPSGSLWVGMDRGQRSLNPTAIVSTNAPLWTSPVGAFRKLDLLFASGTGGYWRLADGRIQKWSGAQPIQPLAVYPWTNSVAVSSACEDLQGNLVVGTLGDGVWWFDALGHADQVSAGQGLSHATVLSLCMDREGSLWVGTDGGGLNRVKRQTFNVVPESRGKTVQSVCEDDRNGLWIGYNGDRIDHLTNGSVETYERSNLLNNVRAILSGATQQVWAATWQSRGLFKLQNGSFQTPGGFEQLGGDISALYQDRAGQLWAGTEGGLARWDGKSWRIFTTRDGLSSDRVRAIAEDPQGALLIGTDGGGLNKLEDGKFSQAGQAEGFSGEKISSLLLDEQGVLWIGTRGQGLVRLKDGKWTRYTRDEGLTSNSIGYLLDDRQGSLWIGSYAGLMRVQKNALADFARGAATVISCRVYGEADGLPSGECTTGSQPAACRTEDKKLWFPTTLGLAWVDPLQISRNTNPPPVIIESVLVDGRPVGASGIRAQLPGSVTLLPGDEHLEIQFTSLNLSAPEKARFKFKLASEKAWTEVAGNSRGAHYPHLPPGDYRFQVIACNEDGVWNETGSSLFIIVKPPFWKTWWFLVTLAVCSVGMVVGSVYYVSTQNLQRQLEGMRQQQALEKERRRIARDIHDQVGASLTQVSMLGEMVESDKDIAAEVEEHGRQISQTARETAKALDEIVWAVNPSNDTLDGLITYFCKYAQEYFSVAGLRYRLDVPAELPQTPIAPDLRHNVFLASKEAVTNIVKHAKATSVCLRLRLEPNRFVLELEDNGKGMAGMDPKHAQTRNGLSNMRKRLEESGGTFSIGPGAEGGTLVRLTAPLGNGGFDAARKPV